MNIPCRVVLKSWGEMERLRRLSFHEEEDMGKENKQVEGRSGGLRRGVEFEWSFDVSAGNASKY